ncbi:hypothetical protein GPUN_1852 [Glaciecola punicea ACAM 611]|uniref:Transposase n=1 Tax=Glaciecola punicea ACAM 611 TaxID=1121923 RepID=H5TCE1_9ALTE|nr:hypothetical protein GPUN_1852 [Glaciecola punicea ACAM 611]
MQQLNMMQVNLNARLYKRKQHNAFDNHNRGGRAPSLLQYI